MDLAYYESPPGLQLLHCLQYDYAVLGGESLLIDAFAVAEHVRRNEPRAFEVRQRMVRMVRGMVRTWCARGRHMVVAKDYVAPGAPL